MDKKKRGWGETSSRCVGWGFLHQGEIKGGKENGEMRARGRGAGKKETRIASREGRGRTAIIIITAIIMIED